MVCVFVVLTLAIYARFAQLQKRMSELERDLAHVKNETLEGVRGQNRRAAVFPDTDASSILHEIMDLYNKVTEDNTQIFYPGANLNLTLSQAIFGDGAYGGLSRGNRIHPAVIARGPVYAEGPLVIDGETADIFIWRSGQFYSLAERLGLGTPEKVIEERNLQPDPDPPPWTSKLCRGAVVGESCPDRHNWGVDSCTLDYDNTSTVCYCGGGYRADITGIVHRHFVCSETHAQCIALFRQESPACCSPTSAAVGCASNTHLQAVCSASVNPVRCCDGLDQRTCLTYGCTWTANACTYMETPAPTSYYLDLYSKCDKLKRHTVCNMQTRTRYLSIYAGYEACAKATTSAQCLLNYRRAVQNEVWDNTTLTSMYNWFDGQTYYLRLPPRNWRDCPTPFLTASPVQGQLKNAYPAAWVCEKRAAQRLIFYLAPWQGDYTQEQGRVAYVLTKPRSEGNWFCLSAPLTKEYNITYHALNIPKEHPLWVSTADADEWDMCARVTMPLTLGSSFAFTRPSNAIYPLGFDFVTKGLRFTDDYTIIVERH
jgi:hypothetical protein